MNLTTSSASVSPDTLALHIYKHPCSDTSSRQMPVNTQLFSLWQLPPTRLTVSHPSKYYKSLHLHLLLPTEPIPPVRLVKCLLLEAEQPLHESAKEKPPVKDFVGCVNKAAISLTVLTPVLLPHSQNTQPPSLCTNFSQESAQRLAEGTHTAAKKTSFTGPNQTERSL